MGANSIRLSIYEAEQGSAKLLINKKDTAGLSSYVKDGALSRDGIKKACRVLTGFRAILENFGIADVHVFCNRLASNISNTQEAVDQIEAETVFLWNVLSRRGRGAAGLYRHFAYKQHPRRHPHRHRRRQHRACGVQRREVLTASSMPVGSLNLFLRHVRGILPNDKMCREIRAEVENELDQLVFAGKKRYSYLYGIGGTIRATAKLANQMFELPDDNQEITTETSTKSCAPTRPQRTTSREASCRLRRSACIRSCPA